MGAMKSPLWLGFLRSMFSGRWQSCAMCNSDAQHEASWDQVRHPQGTQGPSSTERERTIM
jgi:hypothetical protein